MVRHDCAPAFTHNARMRDAFGIAHVHNVPHHVVRVFLERIIRGAIKIAARSVIIHAETATDIEVTKFVSKFTKLRVIARTLAHSALDRRNIRHLRSDMKMKELHSLR